MKFHPSAILWGLGVDLLLSFTVAQLVLFLLGIGPDSPHLYLGSLVLGLAAVSVGGYVTALRAPSDKMLNTVVFALIQLIIGLIIAFYVAMPFWFNVFSFLLIVPAATLGAFVVVNKSN